MANLEHEKDIRNTNERRAVGVDPLPTSAGYSNRIGKDEMEKNKETS